MSDIEEPNDDGKSDDDDSIYSNINDDDDDADENIIENDMSENENDKDSQQGEPDNDNSEILVKDIDKTESTSVDSSDDDSDIDEDSKNDLYKIESMQNDIKLFHSEHNLSTFDEIKPFLDVTRNEYGIINDPYHKTTPILTKYERTRILGLRSIQLSSGLPPFIHHDERIIDPEIIANMELEQKKIPFIIKRPLSNTNYEFWPLQELEII
jgi:DNA-directed RNA polymerase I, II, and III subunit RPABC2